MQLNTLAILQVIIIITSILVYKNCINIFIKELNKGAAAALADPT